MLKKLTSIIIICIIMLESVGYFPTAASEKVMDNSSTKVTAKDLEEAYALIAAIEQELSATGTDVVKELSNFETALREQAAKNSNKNSLDRYYLNKEKVDDNLHRNISEMIAMYKDFKKNQKEFRTDISKYNFQNHENTLVAIPPINPTFNFYTAVVASVIAWFANHNYLLAAELLSHARENYSLDSQYTPVCGDRIEYSPTFWNIRNNYTIQTGKGEFKNVGTTTEQDLYYAIHEFYWFRLSNSYIRISDRYDFETDGYDWSIQGIAVGAMTVAQNVGVLTPFYTIIEHN